MILRCARIAFVVALLLGMAYACFVGPNHKCDSNTPCDNGFTCIEGWCFKPELAQQLQEPSTPDASGGKTE